ncbi:MAG TPA: metal ABC transporter substrate-binding protein, partial [Anaerovoracaceae bacterium]|nr:metal ABC transporter substrate-binding protein [Anaerovoracaceae bacterium]
FVLLLCLVVAVSIPACTGGGQADSGQGDTVGENKIKVSVTFNAMKEFAEAIGKDKVTVSNIMPDGMEPHDFEPKAQDLADLAEAQILVYSGLGLESWVEDAVQAVQNEDLIAVEASRGVTPIENEEPEEIEEHGQYDPHTWLSLRNAMIEAGNIRDALTEADPQNKEYYEGNYQDFVSESEDLFSEYETKFRSVGKKSFVTGHAAFAYLCRDFGLEQNSVEDVFAEGEPTARQLSELVDYCREHGVTTIFAEEMASPEVSETLANEVGAEVQTIYTIESDEGSGTYLKRMEDNLSRIYESLTK